MSRRGASLVEFVELYHERGVHLPTRTIYIGSMNVDVDGSESGTDAKMAEQLVKNLGVLESLAFDPVTIIANNLGGDTYHGLAIYDAIRLSPCDVTVIVRGYAMSMGSLILQAANRRVIGPCATQMVHYGRDAFEGHSKNLQRWAQESDRLNAWVEGVYLDRIRAKHPKYSLRALRELLRFDTFLTAEQSVGLGLADEVG